MFIDSHCHLPHGKYNKTTKDIIQEAKDAGVEKLIVVGTSIKTNEEVIKIAETFDNVYAAVGIFPNDERDKDIDTLLEKLEKQASSSTKVVGIGECGLDITKWTNQRPVNNQIELFEKQVKLGIKLGLPIAFHNRNGDKQILEIIKKYQGTTLTGVAHCFVSDWTMAEKLISMGFMISFTGIITYKSGSNLVETVRKVPLDKFLLETDSPYLPPQDKNGKRNAVNEPKYVKMTAEKVAEIKNLPLHIIEENAYKNTCSLFLTKK